jgi:hypothetical protein
MGSIAPTTHAKILNAASLLMMHLHCIAEQRLPSLETLCVWIDFVSARIDARFFDAPNEIARGARIRRLSCAEKWLTRPLRGGSAHMERRTK